MLPVFLWLLFKQARRHQVRTQSADSEPANIIESRHLEEAEWDFIQFARMTIRTLIKKEQQITTLVLMCLVQVYPQVGLCASTPVFTSLAAAASC